MRICDGPPLLHFERLQLLNLYFDADLDPDPGASQIMRIRIRTQP
jgi:hypothetical protein